MLLHACSLAALCGLLTGGWDDVLNYDEARVPLYRLPDPLRFADGAPVRSVADWRRRRVELLALMTREMYGQLPPPVPLRHKVFDDEPAALGGTARRRQVTLYFTPDDAGPQLDLLLYQPVGVARPPVFLGLNFQGNQAVCPDPAIKLSDRWMEPRPVGVEHNRATEASRGVVANRWPLATLLARGYGLATVYCGDLDPDVDDGFRNGLHALFPELQNRGDNCSTMSAWAWGLSRAMDYLATIEVGPVLLCGWSRLGKAALWAGANDERFALVISIQSGAGGAALARRAYGENVTRLCQVFPHWYCQNFRRYMDNEAALPFDSHELLALLAPRPAYVASADRDRGADPRGEFLAAVAAGPVYRLHGLEGLPSDVWPPVGQPLHGTLGYHLRAGHHDVTAEDWGHFLDFADRQLGRGR